MAKGTGHGAQLGFGTTGSKWAPAYTSLGTFGYDRETLDSTHLGTKGTRDYIQGDVFGITPFSAVYWWEPDNPDDSQDEYELLFDSGEAAAPENVTLTMPSKETFAGPAFVAGLEYGEITTDILLSGTINVQWTTAPVKSAAP